MSSALFNAFATEERFFEPLMPRSQPPPHVDPWTHSTFALGYSFPSAQPAYENNSNDAPSPDASSSYAGEDARTSGYNSGHSSPELNVAPHALGGHPQTYIDPQTGQEMVYQYHPNPNVPSGFLPPPILRSASGSTSTAALTALKGDPGTPKKKTVTRRNPEKRKEQNRAAQRAFRDRKERRLVDLEGRTGILEDLVREQSAANLRLSSMVHALRADNARLRAHVQPPIPGESLADAQQQQAQAQHQHQQHAQQQQQLQQRMDAEPAYNTEYKPWPPTSQ